MMNSTLPLLVVGLVLAGCSEEPKSADKAAAGSTPKVDLNNNSSGNPLTAPVDYLGAVAKAKKTAEKGAETAALNQQVQLFYAQEGRYPKDLNELVTMSGFDAEVGPCFAGDATLSMYESPVEELTRITPVEMIGGFWREVGTSWKAGATLERNNL